MCVTCGCSETESVIYTDAQSGEQITVPRTGANAHDHLHKHGSDEHNHLYGVAPADEHPFHTQPGPVHNHDHGHGHDHPHAHEHTASGVTTLHPQTQGTPIVLEQDILAKNQHLAECNRGWLAGREILALNLVSSPGSGKTTLLERTIRDLQGALAISVIEGDQATVNDAERIRATGCKAVQINTGTGCHLEADMLARGLQQLNPSPGSVVMIENVGNLICPALFDLGEQAKVVILSVTEGEDKPIKYPHMFKASSVMLLNKIDLLPYLKFDVERCIAYARQVNPAMEIFRVSAETGEGMGEWYDWLRGHNAGRQDARAAP